MPNRCFIETKVNKVSAYPQHIKEGLHNAIYTAVASIEARTKVNIVNNGQVDTGNMLNSVSGRMINELEGEVAVSADYAAFQELGFKGVAGRPFLRPAYDKTVPELEDMLRANLGSI